MLFLADGKIWEPLVQLFGLKPLPCVFTKLPKWILVLLWALGATIMAWLDDFIVGALTDLLVVCFMWWC